MKKILTKVLLLAIFSIALIYPLDLLFSKVIKQSSLAFGEYEVWNDILNSEINAEIAIYGSSRAMMHFNPAILFDSLDLNAYNFGMDGHNLWSQIFRHEQYLIHNPSPKVIIHSADFFTLASKFNGYNNEQFLPYLLWNKNFSQSAYLPMHYSWWDCNIPLLRYRNKGNIILQSFIDLFNTKALRTAGFVGRKWEWNKDFDKAKANMNSYTIKMDSTAIDLFHAYIEECQHKGITVILVNSPVYVEGQKFIDNRDELRAFYNSVADQHNIKYLDYSLHNICNKREYFYNATHLNSRGANAFSSILAKDIKPLIAN